MFCQFSQINKGFPFSCKQVGSSRCRWWWSHTKCLFNVEDSFKKCSHSVGSIPLVLVSVNNHKPCAVLDTGAEISLVTLSALWLVSLVTVLSDRRACDLVGFSGEVTSVAKQLKYAFKWDCIPCVNLSSLQCSRFNFTLLFSTWIGFF